MNDSAVDNVGSRLVAALQKTFGDKLEAVVAHGSAARGGYITDFSDYDFVVYHHGPFTFKEALALQKAMMRLESYPFAYFQATSFVNLDREHNAPTLIPGAYHIIYGFLPPNSLLDREALRQRGREWLQALPDLISTDLRAWSVATGASRARLLRVAWTRLLPAIRAMMVQHGADPLTVWGAPLPKLLQLCEQQIPYLGRRLEQVAGALPGTEAAQSVVGGEIFSMLVDITHHYRRTEPLE